MVLMLVGAAVAASMLAVGGMAWAEEAGELPADPSGLVATAVSASEINLSWTDNANYEAAYVVERSLDGSTGWTELTPTLAADTTSYSDTGLSEGTTYHYRVKATNANGSSGYSNTANATTEASPPPPLTLNETPDSTWMTNGRVWSIVRHGDYVYVGGNFTRARSAASGGSSFAATDLARFDATTGVADRNWTPDVTGTNSTATQVYSLVAAGGKIWVGGKFDAVDGLPRRNLAAVDPLTGAVDPNVKPLIGSETAVGIKAMAASDTRVYVGGGFGSVDGQGRRNLAAFNATTGALDTKWRSKAGSPVRSLALSCDEATVFAGGIFRTASGNDGVFQPRESLARFDAITGALHPWATPTGTVNNDAVAVDMAVTCDRIIVPYQGNNLNVSYRLDDGNAGTVDWMVKSQGEAQTVAMLGPDKVLFGGHFSNWIDGKRTGIALVNLSDGSVDPSWAPVLTASFVSVWETYVDEQSHKVYIGGLFNTVEGVPQTFFARFSYTP
jgi:hypothetical protein